jgi:spoIIIJ-associated protein
MSAEMPMAPMESGDEFDVPRAEAPVEAAGSFDEPVEGTEERAPVASDRGYDRPRRRDREDRRDRGERRDREPREPRESREPALSGEQLQAVGRQVTEDLLRAMGFEATITVTPEDDEKMNVTVQVPDGEQFLTGRKGETRQALQHLLNRMVNRGEGSRYHLQLEINDFWAQREKELEQQARQMADDAISTGNEQVTDYLNAQERRIIHVTLREDARVRTYAIGDGMIKRLAVAPAHAETTEPLE